MISSFKYGCEILPLEYKKVPSERIQAHSDMVGNFQVVNVATQSVVTQLSLCDTQSSKIAIFCSDIKIGYHFSTINHVTNLCSSMMWPFIILCHISYIRDLYLPDKWSRPCKNFLADFCTFAFLKAWPSASLEQRRLNLELLEVQKSATEFSDDLNFRDIMTTRFNLPS